MCVIIDRQPGVTIPLEKLEIACDINKHGFGFSYSLGDGRVRTIRKANKDKANDPKEVFELMETHKDKRVFLHLRHATVGDVSLSNAHPFSILSHESDHVDIGFMHNGTLTDFKPDQTEFSDSYCFAHHVLRPLAVRTGCIRKPEDILKDDLYQEIITLYCEKGYSNMLLFDGFGNVVRIQEKRGKEFDGWWASNDYSFRTTHWRSSQSAAAWESYPVGEAYGAYRPGDRSSNPTSAALPRTTTSGNAASSNVLDFPWNEAVKPPSRVLWLDHFEQPDVQETEEKVEDLIRYECNRVAAAIQAAEPQETSIMSSILRKVGVPRQTFLKVAGLKSLTDIGALTKRDITELCDKYPTAMTELIIDLYAAVINKRYDVVLPNHTETTSLSEHMQ